MATDGASCSVRAAVPVATIHLHGDYDLGEASALADRLAALSRRHRRVEVDMSGVTFFGARALAALAQAWSFAEDHECDLVLTSAAPIVARLIEVSGLRNLLPDESLPTMHQSLAGTATA